MPITENKFNKKDILNVFSKIIGFHIASMKNGKVIEYKTNEKAFIVDILMTLDLIKGWEEQL